jgi:hypothetical protein
LVLVLWRTEGRLPTLPERTSQLIPLSPLEQLRRGIEAPYFTSRPTTARGVRQPPKNPVTPDPGRPAEAAPRPPEVAHRDSTPTPPPGPIPRIGPSLGSGMLWVQPLPLPPRELAQRLTRTTAQLADSIVHSTIQAYLDSIAREPGADRVQLPDWTKEFGGKKYGLDSRYLYIAGYRIPAALLALLPIPGGNQNPLTHKPDVVADLRQAAARAANTADFKQAIQDIRERNEQERAFLRAQLTPPDSAAGDTIRAVASGGERSQ